MWKLLRKKDINQMLLLLKTENFCNLVGLRKIFILNHTPNHIIKRKPTYWFYDGMIINIPLALYTTVMKTT